FRRKRELDLLPCPATADDRRDREADIAEAVEPLLQRADRQDLAIVLGDRLDDVANRDANSEAGTALQFDDFRPAALRLLKDFLLKLRREAGELFERQPVDGRARPDWHHAVPVLAEDQGIDLRRRQLELAGDEAAEARRVELRAQADDALPGQTDPLHRE